MYNWIIINVTLLVLMNCLLYVFLKDACKLLEGEGGKGRLSRLQSTINARRLLMVAQIAALYRIVPSVPTAANKVMQDRGEKNVSLCR